MKFNYSIQIYEIAQKFCERMYDIYENMYEYVQSMTCMDLKAIPKKNSKIYLMTKMQYILASDVVIILIDIMIV